MTAWINPVPRRRRKGVLIYRPDVPATTIAEAVCTRAYRGKGVRVYAWPCGTVAVVPVDVDADRYLAEVAGQWMLATYAGKGGAATRHADVVDEIVWARSGGVTA